jgi:hypothetical protein
VPEARVDYFATGRVGALPIGKNRNVNFPRVIRVNVSNAGRHLIHLGIRHLSGCNRRCSGFLLLLRSLATAAVEIEAARIANTQTDFRIFMAPFCSVNCCTRDRDRLRLIVSSIFHPLGFYRAVVKSGPGC